MLLYPHLQNAAAGCVLLPLRFPLTARKFLDVEKRMMSLKGKRVAVLAEDMYEDPELWYPYYRLSEAGAEVQGPLLAVAGLQYHRRVFRIGGEDFADQGRLPAGLHRRSRHGGHA